VGDRKWFESAEITVPRFAEHLTRTESPGSLLHLDIG
jgi:hypothetical protein